VFNVLRAPQTGVALFLRSRGAPRSRLFGQSVRLRDALCLTHRLPPQRSACDHERVSVGSRPAVPDAKLHRFPGGHVGLYFLTREPTFGSLPAALPSSSMSGTPSPSLSQLPASSPAMAFSRARRCQPAGRVLDPIEVQGQVLIPKWLIIKRPRGGRTSSRRRCLSAGAEGCIGRFQLRSRAATDRIVGG